MAVRLISMWTFLWSIALGLTWLLPNHYRPWLSFFSNAWVTTLVFVAGFFLLVRDNTRVEVYRPVLWAVALACVPWAQHAAGLLPFEGDAWIYSLLLLAFAFTQALGALWQRTDPNVLADSLFLSIGAVCVLSVGLQAYQVLDGDHLGLAVMWSPADRPFANLGQPNQLATLHMWGLVAVLWGLERAVFGRTTALLVAVVLLFGIALTGSRAAWVGLVLMWTLIGLQRARWREPRLLLAATGLAMLFAAMVVFKSPLTALLLEGPQSVGMQGVGASARLSQTELRLPAWLAMADAIQLQPWFGYGVGQGVAAQMAVALDHPNLGHTYSYAHNLLVDIFIWMGIPLGALVVAAIGIWLLNLYRATKDAGDSVLFLAVVVVLSHAMFEMPLYYAYFLLPLGLILGVLYSRTHQRFVLSLSKGWVFGLLVTGALMWGVLLRDYARVEVEFARLEMEWNNIQLSSPPKTPDLVMLDQWETYIHAIRIKPLPGLTQADVEMIRQGLVVYPTMRSFRLLAAALVLNDQPKESREWLIRACKTGDCSGLKAAWAYDTRRDPRYAAVPWPMP